MRSFVGIALLALSCAAWAAPPVQLWSTATATRPSDGWTLVYRFADRLSPEFKKSSQPERVTIIWRYKGNNGLPVTPEQESMDALEPSMQKPNRAAYTAAEFLDWSSTKALVLSPKFQRRGVWQSAARSFFIDTLLREMPVPPVYLRMSQSAGKDRVVREVIDGQQRISAVTAYMRDEFALSGSLISQWKGRRFSQLSADERSRIRDYPFSAEVFSSLTDAEVLEVFSRLT